MVQMAFWCLCSYRKDAGLSSEGKDCPIYGGICIKPDNINSDGTCKAGFRPLFERLARYEEAIQNRPEIICLCGSTRFYDAFQKANYDFTMQGKIVLSVGFYPHSQVQAHSQTIGCTPEQKQALDELHKRKIDLCDTVFVLNVDDYIGESTRSEIEYAEKIGKPVYYLETPCFVSKDPCPKCGFPTDEDGDCHMCNADES
jgi:hypothetical protein